MEFKEAMRIWKRMCISQDDDRGCDDCPMCGPCGGTSSVLPDETEAILAGWASEHPEKTIADDFFEKHPKAMTLCDRIPVACAKHVGYIEECVATKNCAECWRRPLEEVE